MSNYADKDAILQIIKDWQKIDTTNADPNDDTPIYSRRDWKDWQVEFYLDVVNELEKLQAEDVAPVVYGEWQDIGVWSEVNRVKINSCSNCHYHYVGFGSEFAYCPSCGAKMDLRGNE